MYSQLHNASTLVGLEPTTYWLTKQPILYIFLFFYLTYYTFFFLLEKMYWVVRATWVFVLHVMLCHLLDSFIQQNQASNSQPKLAFSVADS